MKLKRIFAGYLAALILLLLIGCQLAREDAGENSNEDRLIGVFITTEQLDLFDMEAYLNDNINKISRGGKITVDSRKYQGRLYATLTTETLTSEETGKTTEIQKYVFEGVDGIAYFSATMPATDNSVGYIASSSDEAISDGHVSYHQGDDEEKTTLEGTIYLLPEHAGGIRFINPVYQSSDGSVYATTGGGHSFEGVRDEGRVFASTLKETQSITENGSTKSVSIAVEIWFNVMFPPQRIVVLQMGADSTVLTRTEYVPGELPGKLTPEPSTKYIVVETYKKDPEGNDKIFRRLYDKNDKALETFFCREDGICVKRYTQLEWGNSPAPMAVH